MEIIHQDVKPIKGAEERSALVSTLQSNVPAELRERPQWVLWRLEKRRDKKTGQVKPTKVPYQARYPERKAASNKLYTWAPFDVTLKVLLAGHADGIGYVFSKDDPFAGTDLDHCIDEQSQIATWARAQIDTLASYTEYSPSGHGAHIIVKAKLPGGGIKRDDLDIEMYDQVRFFTFTGRLIEGAPHTIEERQEEITALYVAVTTKPKKQQKELPPEEQGTPLNLSDQELLERARKSKDGSKFAALWNGDTSEYSDNASVADFALCCRLAFWTGKDKTRMDTLFRQSPLLREKWDEKHSQDGRTYGQMTIDKACEVCEETYKPQRTKQRRSVEQEASGAENAKAGRPVVIVNNRDLHEVADEALDKLIAANEQQPTIFVRGGALCRIRRDEQGQPIIETLTVGMLRHELSLCASFARKTENGYTLVAPSDMIVKDIQERPEWHLPPLLALSETPPIRANGSICTTPGYDAATNLYYVPAGLQVPVIPDTPSAQEVSEARAIIDDLLYDFLFVDQASIANCYALFLTPLLRAAISGAVPMGLIDAPQAGNGKGLLADSVALVATGRTAYLLSPAEDEAEWRKRITSALLDGSSIVALDNLEHPLRSAALAQAITALIWSDRVLGASKQVNLPVRCSWLATGNNIQPGGDMPRRTYWIRINTKMAQPWRRGETHQFKHPNLRGYIRENRGRIIAALLTLVRAWYVAGCPQPENAPILGSFEEWSRIIGGILAHAGITGFLSNLNDLYKKADKTSFQWECFLIALYKAYSNAAFSAKTIISDLANENERSHLIREALPENLADALAATGHSTGQSFATRLGMALSSRVDTRFGDAGWHLSQRGQDSRSGVQMYRVFKEGTPEGGNTPQEADGAQTLQTLQTFFTQEEEISPRNACVEKGEGQREKIWGREAERSARSARSADISPYAPSRDLLNAAPANDGTAALDPTHAPIAVQERDDQAEPISLKDVREQRSNTHLPWQPAWNDMHIKQRLYRMAEALDFPICEIAGIVEGGKAAWYNLCYEPGYINEAAEAHDTLMLRFERS